MKSRIFLLFISLLMAASPIIQAENNKSQLISNLVDIAHSYNNIDKNSTSSEELQSRLIEQCLLLYNNTNKQLLEIADLFTQTINYWKLQQLGPKSYFITKNPLKWFSGPSQQQELQNHIYVLEYELKKISYHIGRLHAHIHKLQKDKSTNAFEEFLNAVEDCLQQRLAQHNNDQNSSEMSIPDKIKKYFMQLKSLKKNMLLILEPHKRPHHLIRNWLPYTIGVVGTAALAYYFYKNPVHIPTVGETKDASRNFLNKHVINPTKDIWNTFFKEQKSNPNQSEVFMQHYTNKIKTHLKNKSPEEVENIIKAAQEQNLGPIIDLTSEALHAEAPAGILKKLLYVLSPEEVKKISNVIYKIDPTANSIDILISAIVLMIIELKNKIDNVMESNRILFSIALMVPAAAAIVGAYKGSKQIINWLTPNKNFIRKPLQTNLRELERILNKNNNDNQISYEDNGMLLYYTDQLKKYGNWLTKEQYISFMNDISELESIDFAIHQKLTTVMRMFRSYEFLAQPAI